MDLLDGHGLHAGTSGNSHRRENGQKDQKGLGEFANAEPDDDQRQIGQRRQWTIEFDNRVEQATHDTIDTHQYANWNRRDQGQEKAAKYRSAGRRVWKEGGSTYGTRGLTGT